MGKLKSNKKAAASRKNGAGWQKPHFKKCRHFEKVYPYELQNNEWKYKFPLQMKTPTGKEATYNPDYLCTTTGYYIEVATSKPNVVEQRERWRRAIELGLKLKVYWWEGNEITNEI